MSATGEPKLRAFIVTAADEPPEEGAALVYALSPQEARRLGCHEVGIGGVAYIDSRARRAKEHDARAALAKEACVEHDAEYLRKAGWGNEDELRCGSCGLCAMGLEKYAVCRMSGQCKECGCDFERKCGATGVDAEGHCKRCGLTLEPDTECPLGFLTDVDPKCEHDDGFSCE
jgi:hypothetical protein